MKEIKEVKTGELFPEHGWIWRLKTPKMSGLPILIYWFNIIKTGIIVCVSSISVLLLKYFYGLEYSVSWWMFGVHLKWMCILLMFFKVFLKCPLRQVGWLFRLKVVLRSSTFSLIFSTLLIIERDIFKSLLFGSCLFLFSISFCFVKKSC